MERLGELLREAGFGRERHSALARYPGGVPPADLFAAIGRPEDARLARLIEIFHHGAEGGAAELGELIAPVALDELVDAGLVERDGERVRARLALAAIGGVIVVGDPDAAWGRRDFVAGVSPTGRIVAYTTVRRAAATALDLGTGSGVQALLAAAHSERVTAVDISPRALELAQLGARLGAVGNVDWVAGDWSAPVTERRFDLVVANPPVVISPDVTMLARDSESGDQAGSMVAESARLLEDGGYATVFCNWAYDDDWEAAPRRWVEGSGCDALLVRIASQDPVAYAMTNLAGRPGAAANREDVERWAGHYAREGIEQIAVGVVVLRRRAGAEHWVRAVEPAGAPDSAGGDQLERMFAGGDFLARANAPAALLASRWTAADGHRFEQSLRFGEGEYVRGDAVLTHPGLKLSVPIAAPAAPVVVGCDGTATVAELIARSGAAESEAVCLDALSELIALGFLVQM